MSFSSQVKSSKSGHHQTNRKSDSVSLTKSKSVTDIPSSSCLNKEKERTNNAPLLKTRKHKIESEQTLGIEFEHKIKKISSKHNLESTHKIDNIESQYTKNNHQEPSSSNSTLTTIETGKKHKSRKDKKNSRSPSSSKSKKSEDDKLKEDQKPRDKSKEDKIHKNNKINLHSKSDISFKEKQKKSDKKHLDYNSFEFRFSSSIDSLSPSTSAGNLTYPQVSVAKFSFPLHPISPKY